MSRIIVILFLSCIVDNVFAQEFFEMINRDPLMAASNYCVYPDKDSPVYSSPQSEDPFLYQPLWSVFAEWR